MNLFKVVALSAMLLSFAPQARGADPSAVASPAAAKAEADAEDPAAELLRLRAQLQKAYEPLNALNPMSTAFNPVAAGAEGTAPTASSSPTVQTLRHGWQAIYQAGDRLLNNPGFIQGVEGIAKSPSRMDLLYAQLALMFLILGLRMWRFGKCEHWYGRIWTNIWTGGLYWISSLVLVPWLVIGQPYYRAMVGIASLWTK